MKNIIFTSVLILTMFISCKQKPKLSEVNQVQESISNTTSNEKEIESLNTSIDKQINCINTSNSNFIYPIQGGSQLIALGMEEKIELREFKCEISEKLKLSLCLTEDISYYFLKNIKKVNTIIIYDECGDNNQYILATYLNNELIDILKIYSFWTDGEGKENITDFEILKNFEIKIIESELENNKKIKNIEIFYKINSKGKIVKL